MRRREFLEILGGAVIAVPGVAIAQGGSKSQRIGRLCCTDQQADAVGPYPHSEHSSRQAATQARAAGGKGKKFAADFRNRPGRFPIINRNISHARACACGTPAQEVGATTLLPGWAGWHLEPGRVGGRLPP